MIASRQAIFAAAAYAATLLLLLTLLKIFYASRHDCHARLFAASYCIFASLFRRQRHAATLRFRFLSPF
jgi:hypothetical protein